jgi:hypothetical protein
MILEGRIADRMPKQELLRSAVESLVTLTLGLLQGGPSAGSDSDRARVRDGDKPPYMDLPNAPARLVTTTMRLHRLWRLFGEVQQDLLLSSLTIGQAYCLLKVLK